MLALADSIASSMAGNVSAPLRRMRTRLPVRHGAPVVASTSRAKAGVPGLGGSSIRKPVRLLRR